MSSYHESGQLPEDSQNEEDAAEAWAAFGLRSTLLVS